MKKSQLWALKPMEIGSPKKENSVEVISMDRESLRFRLIHLRNFTRVNGAILARQDLVSSQ